VVVKVLFFGMLRDLTGFQEDTADVPTGTTLEMLFGRYAERFETLRQARPSIMFARNREFTSPDSILAEQDEIAFLPPVSGGSGSLEGATETEQVELIASVQRDGHIFGLTRSIIDSRHWVSKLQQTSDGAVVVFEGVVRDNTKGRRTLYLEYECYEQMAAPEMARIGLEIVSRFPVGRIGMIHRLGRLQVGEASVVVICTAPHRKAAFEAALEGINRLKREVPIWKKEFFEDGAVWVEGEWDEKLPGRPASAPL
jgi:molybdopterin converting factor subunit 1